MADGVGGVEGGEGVDLWGWEGVSVFGDDEGGGGGGGDWGDEG